MTLDTFCNLRSTNRKQLAGLTPAILVIAILLGFSGSVWSGMGRAIASEAKQEALPKTTFFPDAELLDLDLLKPGNIPASVVTATTISETGLSFPSLWWVKDQYSAQKKYGSRLIENWIAYSISSGTPGRVDYVVNRQLWNQLDYLQRYAFIHEFGTAARGYGYNLRVFDNQANFLAAYTCDFSASQTNYLSKPPSSQPLTSTTASAPIFSSYVQPSNITCYTSLDFGGKAGLGGSSNQTGGGTSRESGTARP